MSYQVLARKWRPGRFSELVGQDHVVTAIANALDNDRLHHAYLFTGTRGVGKTTIARIFSKSLNCEEGQGANPCGKCDTCKEIEHGNYVDLLEIDAASRTKVEDTRELLDNVQYKPTRGRFKVYLIDEVHMLSKHSFNALLKTLEEPPPHVKFLLATTDPQKLPVTILSRCLQFNLKALSREQITGQLQYVLQQEAIPFEEPALALLARAAQGSMRDALSLTDQAIAQGDNRISTAIVTDMLGLMDRHQLLKLLYAVVQKKPHDLMEIVAQMAEQSPDYNQLLAELSSLLHQIALTQWVPDVCKLETTSAKAIYQLAKQVPAEQVQLLYQIALQGRKDMPYAAEGRSGLEMTLLRMMSFAPTAPVKDPEHVIAEQAPAAVLPQHEEMPDEDDVDGSRAETAGAGDETDNFSIKKLAEEQAAIEQQAGQYRVSSNVPRPVEAESEGQNTAEPFNDSDDAAEEPANMALRDIPPFDNTPDYAEDYFSIDDPSPFQESYQGQQEENVSAESEASSQSAPDDDSAGSLSSMEEMLALRQRLKRSRGEASDSSVKKSDKVTEVARDIRRQPAKSHFDQAKSASPAVPVVEKPERKEAQKALKEANPTPVDSTPDDKNDVPPWVMEGIPDNVDSGPGYSQVNSPVDGRGASTTFATTTKPNPSVNAIEPDAPMVASASDVAEAGARVTVEISVNPESTDTPVSLEQGSLPAYLPNGKKLLEASQIDEWSHLISQMPVAGLVKQIVLHSAFSQQGSAVTLELDASQSHLLNDGAVAQVNQALNQVLGMDVTLNIEKGEPQQTPFSLQQQINEMRQHYAQQVVASDESFQSLLTTFNASVLPDTVKAR
ncbi:DNA polymerase III subunit gamma/tau [Alteromonas pelagimontana]|uniref:DNA-directed DNA polymerase n=1 Tax=Alteromonas pelagimontana TaxID=1858656 RepID=A0A6M4MG92_9ALTE|nr:DNA polymerase III subunit gamma/tau [Alteromonas pelagimontana]QJR82139.1 DNA polymerase III subunit gamma/tau [Alteromonas pelagimontana]